MRVVSVQAEPTGYSVGVTVSLKSSETCRDEYVVSTLRACLRGDMGVIGEPSMLEHVLNRLLGWEGGGGLNFTSVDRSLGIWERLLIRED